MTFRRGARLDPGQVRDARGSGGGGGFGFPGGFGGGFGSGRSTGGGLGVPASGGIGGIIVLAVILGVFYFLNGGSGGTGALASGGLQQGPLGSNIASCQTGADANAREDCRIVGYVNSVNAYWEQEFATEGRHYTPAQTTLFTNQYETGCGTASSQTGPFYCPPDKNVYLDTNFFAVIVTELNGTAAPLAQAYVVAHEYGHHVQDLEGTLSRSQDGDTGPTSNSVRIELQADCYAGVWAAHAVDTGYIEPLAQSDVTDALTEAKAVGDDWIAQQNGGSVQPDQWTHGSSEQRVRWFSNGYQGGTPKNCDTFSTNAL